MQHRFGRFIDTKFAMWSRQNEIHNSVINGQHLLKNMAAINQKLLQKKLLGWKLAQK